MWSLLDGRDVLAEIDPRFRRHIDRHIRAVGARRFHVSANTDRRATAPAPAGAGPRHACARGRETDDGIVIRGAKYETAAAYADQAFLKPTIGDWRNEELSDYAVGCIVKMGAPGVKHICRAGFAGAAATPTIRWPTVSTKSTC